MSAQGSAMVRSIAVLAFGSYPVRTGVLSSIPPTDPYAGY